MKSLALLRQHTTVVADNEALEQLIRSLRS